MLIASWNINSVRLRMPLLKDLVSQKQPDIICLQETKVVDELFPLKEINNLGYNHVIFRGQKSYNGVAILSKIPLKDTTKLNIANIDDARHISGILANNMEIHNLYIPAGGDEPDININPKFKHKLDYLEDISSWFLQNKQKDDKIILTGDFNIAPYEHDVWSHKQLLKVVSHTPIEVEKLTYFKNTLDWVDCARHFVDLSDKSYSWWSYRNKNWRKSNRGRRLDHIWVTPILKEYMDKYFTLEDARDWNKPSDHIPIFMKMKI